MSLIGGSPSSAITLDAGQSVTLTASVVNDSAAAGVSWVLSGAGSLAGSACQAISGSTQCTNVYTAPATATPGTAITVTATSVHTPSQSVMFSITVNAALAITSPAALPAGTINKAYTTTLTATGGTGTLTWTVASGSLPAGLTLIPSTGVLTGTPTAAGAYSFPIGVRDSATTPLVVTQPVTLVINPAPPVVTTASLPTAAAGLPYSQQLAFSGGTGTGTYAVVSGTLPSGVTLSSSGLLSGTPTLSSGGQTYTFAVQVTSGTQTSAAQTLTLSVTNPPVVTTTSLPPANLTSAYSQQLAFSGGVGSTPTWAITSGALPAGLTLSSSGLISGTAMTLGTSSFSVAVTVGVQTSTAQPLTLTVSNLFITSPNSASGEVKLPFNFKATVSGGTGPYTWSLAAGSAGLPAGLSLNAASGLISGTPTTAGTTTITLQVADATLATATQSLNIKIQAARGNSLNAKLLGSYAFLLSGFDAGGAPLTTAGNFVADGAGNIVSGVLDRNGTGISPSLNQALNASTYNVGADGRGTVTLTAGATTYTFVIALRLTGVTTASPGGSMLEYDLTANSISGKLYLQDATSFTTLAISGGYAFGLGGYASSTSSRAGEVGELQLAGATGSVSSGEFITSSLGATPLPTSGGTYSVAANGRGTASVTVTGGQKLSFVFYPVSAAQLLLLSTDASTTATPAVTGQALSQTTANGSFALTSLNGSAVLSTQRTVGLPGSFAPDVRVGTATFTGAGKASFAGDESAAGIVTALTQTGSYSVAPNGRITYLLQSGIGGCLDCSTLNTVGYLAGTNLGFTLDFAATPATGNIDPQTAAAPTGMFVESGLQPSGPGTTQREGVVTIAGSTGTLTFDSNSAGNLAADNSLTVTGVLGTTRSVVAGSDGSSLVVYPLSASRALVLSLSTPQPLLRDWQQ